MKLNNRVRNKNTPNRRKFPDEIKPSVLLKPNEIEAIKLISEMDKIPVLDLFKYWIMSGIENTHQSAWRLSIEGGVDEKSNAQKFLPRLKELLGPPMESKLYINGHLELENAIVAAKALLQLFFEVIEHTDNTSFINDNGHLAAGVQEIMWQTQKRLRNAFNSLSIGYK